MADPIDPVRRIGPAYPVRPVKPVKKDREPGDGEERPPQKGPRDDEDDGHIHIDEHV